MRPSTRQRGFALVTVLWTLAFLALLGSGMLADARLNTQRVRNLLDAAAAETAAEAALHQAIFALLDPSERRWRPDGRVHLLAHGEHRMELRIEDENGKVNPNLASPELLQALLLQLGVDRQGATALAAMIVEWRSPAFGPAQQRARAQPYAAAGRDIIPPGTPFESLDELAEVLGMTPALLTRLKPHLTLFTTSAPDLATRDPVVAAALGVRARGAASAGTGEETGVVTITISVQGARRTRYAERVSLRTNALTEVRRYEILAREPLP
jgi:general secretion pathway protein K